MSPMPQLLFLITILVCAGATNMAFVKSFGRARLRPIDGGILLGDGKRLFGDHKTWLGFFGMIAITAIWFATAGWLATSFPAVDRLSLIRFDEFNAPFDVWFFGALWGFAYVMAELPNSYLKRRIDIPPGQNGQGLNGRLFLMLDQADSVIGGIIVMPLFCSITWWDALALIVLGSFVHYLTNLGLYAVRLKNQAG